MTAPMPTLLRQANGSAAVTTATAATSGHYWHCVPISPYHARVPSHDAITPCSMIRGASPGIGTGSARHPAGRGSDPALDIRPAERLEGPVGAHAPQHGTTALPNGRAGLGALGHQPRPTAASSAPNGMVSPIARLLRRRRPVQAPTGWNER